MPVYISCKKLKTVSFLSLQPKQSFNDVYCVVYTNALVVEKAIENIIGSPVKHALPRKIVRYMLSELS